jgi:hypothetical protein
MMKHQPARTLSSIAGLTLAALLLLPPMASAEEGPSFWDEFWEEEYPGEGGYFVISGVGAIDTKDAGGDWTSGGLGARVGGFAIPYMAFEMQYDWAHEVAHILTVNMRGQPFTGPIQPYAVLGFGFTSLEPGDLWGVWRAGGGVDFYINETYKVVLDASYVTTFTDNTDLRHVILGLGMGMVF